MSAEAQPFRSKSLTGFVTSPNPEAHDLEHTLGIRFSHAPERVELGIKNRATYLVRGGQRIEVRNVVVNNLAFYLREYNAIFVAPGEERRYVAWHENMHSYAASGGIAELRDARELLLGPKRHDVDPAQVEAIATQAALNEGLADWGAFRTATEVCDEEGMLEASYRDHTIANTIEQKHDAFHEGLIRLRSFLEKRPKIIIPTMVNDPLSKIFYASYLVGYYFVREAMTELQEAGISIASAIDDLLKSPPSTIEDLKDPKGFVSNRLST